MERGNKEHLKDNKRKIKCNSTKNTNQSSQLKVSSALTYYFTPVASFFAIKRQLKANTYTSRAIQRQSPIFIKNQPPQPTGGLRMKISKVAYIIIIILPILVGGAYLVRANTTERLYVSDRYWFKFKWSFHSEVKLGEQQLITIQVFDKETGEPASNITVHLEIWKDMCHYVISSRETDANGFYQWIIKTGPNEKLPEAGTYYVGIWVEYGNPWEGDGATFTIYS